MGFPRPEYPDTRETLQPQAEAVLLEVILCPPFTEVDLLMCEEWDTFDVKTKDRCQQDSCGSGVHGPVSHWCGVR